MSARSCGCGADDCRSCYPGRFLSIHDGPLDDPDHEGAEPDVEVDDASAACAAEGAWTLGRDWGASQ